MTTDLHNKKANTELTTKEQKIHQHHKVKANHKVKIIDSLQQSKKETNVTKIRKNEQVTPTRIFKHQEVVNMTTLAKKKA